MKKAAQFGHVAQALLAAHGLGREYVRHAEEFTGNLSYLLGIHQRQ